MRCFKPFAAACGCCRQEHKRLFQCIHISKWTVANKALHAVVYGMHICFHVQCKFGSYALLINSINSVSNYKVDPCTLTHGYYDHATSLNITPLMLVTAVEFSHLNINYIQNCLDIV